MDEESVCDEISKTLTRKPPKERKKASKQERNLNKKT